MWRSRLSLAVFVITAFLCGASESIAWTSTNVPVGSSAYRDLDRLEIKGFLNGALLATKPLSRWEVLRLVNEAEEKMGEGSTAGAGAWAIIARLREGLGGGHAVDSTLFIDPFLNANVKAFYSGSTPHFASVNNNGDTLSEGVNLRARYSLSAGAFDALSVTFSPEYRFGEEDSYGELIYGYAKLDLWNLTLQAGRDSMWWGAGYHGNLIMTNNAKPFDMVKLTLESPALLPWVFRYLGPFKPTLFLTKLEEDRDFPYANLFGMRLDFKPFPSLQFGLNRVFMFGGEGSGSLDLNDWMNVFTAMDSAEHSASPIDGNQIASIDASYVFVNEWKYLPFSGIKLYTEWGAEDSSGDTKTPTGRANIYGVLVDEPFWFKDFDFRVEWANTARNARYGPTWYTHGKYTTGYTYEGNVIGHHMGGDSRDLFLRVQYYFRNGAVAGMEADLERSGVHSSSEVRRRWLGGDVEYPFSSFLVLSGGAGYEDIEDPDEAEAGMDIVTWMKAEWLL